MLYLGFTVAFAIDIFAIFSSLQPTTDAGFALIFAIIFSPIVLVIALVIMLLVFGFQRSRLGSPQ
ncbi:hypothetical protein COU91_00300 [Candidatus Saccharibacteria bacterium CG10_big_fil_rev_8_21_14_0_10_47_8]|nr:MAG: hypothetical protein COU91_00300 [Candidatus Saccharibacteria bacterium CG10_big_fil_rev_8_21_14_0_10_47_8]